MSLACIVFDCDGVILDSVPTKTRAFASSPGFSLRSWDGKSRLRSPRNGESVLLPILWRK